jgi:hypothetical protein
MFRTRAEVWESLQESFQMACFFLGAGVVLSGLLIGFAFLHYLQCG